MMSAEDVTQLVLTHELGEHSPRRDFWQHASPARHVRHRQLLDWAWCFIIAIKCMLTGFGTDGISEFSLASSPTAAQLESISCLHLQALDYQSVVQAIKLYSRTPLDRRRPFLGSALL